MEIPKRCIRDNKVVLFNPNFNAAPLAPATTPLVSLRACIIRSRSSSSLSGALVCIFFSMADGCESTCFKRDGLLIFNSFSCKFSVEPRVKITARSIIFSSSRTFPALDKVGLLDKAKNYPIQLSGGEQQRVGIARAVVNKPTVLLADEPTGNLDGELSEGIMRLFEEFNRVGVTVLMATHDMTLVERRNYRILTLGQGRMVGGQNG